MPQEKIDLLPGDAGGAAAASAGEFVENLFGDGGDEAPPQEQPDAQPDAQPSAQPEAEEDAGFMGGFKPIADEPKPGGPLKPSSEEQIPDHVARKGDKAIATWKQMRAELDEANRKAADIERDRQLKEQELEEMRKKLESAPPAEEIETLKRQLQEKEDFIGRVDVTRSKVFQETYDKPLNELFGKTVRQFMKAGHDQAQALELSRRVFRDGMADPQKLEQVLPDESAVVIGAVSSLLEDRDVLAGKRDAAIKDWRATTEAARAEETRRASTEIGAQLTRVSEQALEAVVKDGSWLFQRGQDPKWNEGVEARRNAAIGYIRAGKPEDLARLVFEGISSPVYRKGYEQLKTKYDDLKAKYDAIANRGRPSLGQHAPAPSGTPARESAAPASLDGYLAENWG